MPDFAHYQEMLDTPQYVPGYPQMNIIPISFTMSEYLSVGVPLPYGGVPGTPVNHGIRHAWYPNFECRPHGTRNVRGRREQSGMRLEAVKKGTVHEYARYEPEEQELPLQCPKVHDEDAQCVVCEKRQQVLSGRRGDNTTSPDDQLGASLVADELLHRTYTETQAALPSHLNLDELIEEEMRSLTDDDPDHDSVYKTCPGWQDVVIAGEVRTFSVHAPHNELTFMHHRHGRATRRPGTNSSFGGACARGTDCAQSSARPTTRSYRRRFSAGTSLAGSTSLGRGGCSPSTSQYPRSKARSWRRGSTPRLRWPPLLGRRKRAYTVWANLRVPHSPTNQKRSVLNVT